MSILLIYTPSFLAEKQRFVDNVFNVQCDFNLYNNHKMMSNRQLWVYKASAVLENYNFKYNQIGIIYPINHYWTKRLRRIR